MTKAELMNTVSGKFRTFKFTVVKHSPEILAVTGAVGAVASTVWACKQTTKLSGILEERKAHIEQIREVIEHPETLPAGAEYDIDKDGKRDLTIEYSKMVVDVVKLYAGPVILGTLSLTAMLTSNNILRKRNVALMTAYTALDKGYREYRNRVVERFGKDMDRELLYNIKAKEVTEKVVNEDGTETEVTKTVEVVDENAVEYSPYAMFFDEYSEAWTKDPQTNKCFLLNTQSMLNDRLKAPRADGRANYIFLNEVYDALGLKATSAGQIVGWMYDPNDPTVGKDRCIDFGIFDGNKFKNREFVNGYERSILLDFNVDGPIWDKI